MLCIKNHTELRIMDGLNIKGRAIKLFIFICLCGINLLVGAEIRRGPYLLNPHPKGITIKWRTDDQIKSQISVRIGISPEDLPTHVKVFRMNPKKANKVDWIARIENLKPNTKYYYAIEADFAVIAGADKEHFFRTVPEQASTEKEYSFWLLGDSGSNRPFSDRKISPFGTDLSTPIKVREGFHNFMNGKSLDGIIMLGDNAYPMGTDREYQTAFFNVFKSSLKTTPILPCTGNHDMDLAFLSIFADPFHNKMATNPGRYPLYYSTEIGDVHFTFIDPWKSWLESTSNPDHPEWKKQLKWLETDFRSSKKKWNVLVNHFPFYCDGDYNSDTNGALIQLREMIAPLVDKYGIDLVVSGHDHSYQRTHLIKEHYGKSDTFDTSKHLVYKTDNASVIYKKSGPYSGTVYVVSGAASGERAKPKFDHSALVKFGSGKDAKKGIAQPGSFFLNINQNKLTGKQIGTNGEVLDEFFITKKN